MVTYFEMLITVVVAVLGSSGLWTFIQKKTDKKDARIKLLIGLAHDRIMQLGLYYINRGYITADEYENLYNYLYAPYKELGGDGSGDRIMDEVKKVPVRDHPKKEENGHDS